MRFSQEKQFSRNNYSKLNMDFWTLVIILGIGSVALLFAVFGFCHCVDLIFERKSKVRPEMPPQDNTLQAVYDMYIELYTRQLGIPPLSQTSDVANLMSDFRPASNKALVEFIRVAHFVGCEVTLRIRSENDFENDPESTELCVSRQRQE